MKKNKKNRIGLFSSRNKWARRGRNLAHFSMSLIFYVFAYIFYGLAVAIKWVFSFYSTVKKAGRSNTKITDIQINVCLPDRFSRLKVLMTLLEDKLIEENFDIGNIIDLTDGYSEAGLKKLVNLAVQKASSRNISQEPDKIGKINEIDFALAICDLKPVSN